MYRRDLARRLGHAADDRQHRHLGGLVVLADPERERPEVRRGPVEDHREQQQRRHLDPARDRRPADDRRQRARGAADDDVLGRRALEQRSCRRRRRTPIASSVRNDDSRFTAHAISTIEIAPSTIPKTRAFSGVTWWAGSGRRRVRVISRSMSRSRYWLIALAEPAASVPQTSVQKVRRSQSASVIPGTSRVARTIAGIVVTSSSSMIRGLVRAM